MFEWTPGVPVIDELDHLENVPADKMVVLENNVEQEHENEAEENFIEAHDMNEEEHIMLNPLENLVLDNENEDNADIIIDKVQIVERKDDNRQEVIEIPDEKEQTIQMDDSMEETTIVESKT
jgi:hypothetical protein